MTEREALKMTLESLIVSLPDLKGYWKIKAEDAIKAAKEALALPNQDHVIGTMTWFEDDKVVTQYLYQSDIRNFCQRCGKRLGKNDWDMHTCTPPRGKD